MKLEDIIKDEDRLLRGDWFTTAKRLYKIKWDGRIFVYKNNDDIIYPYYIVPSDFLFKDWHWVEENKWYEGDFKKKYPNGVVCYVWNDNSNRKYKTIITNYLPNDSYPFWTPDEITWQFAEPVKLEEAPAIIGGKNE